ncbi:hypothetical protein C0992_010677, partial [Termitomyces sp. T32_za158]
HDVCTARALKMIEDGNDNLYMNMDDTGVATDIAKDMAKDMAILDHTLSDSEDEDEDSSNLFDMSTIEPQLVLNAAGLAPTAASSIEEPSLISPPSVMPEESSSASLLLAQSTLPAPSTMDTSHPLSSTLSGPLPLDPLASQPVPAATDAFIFPATAMSYDQPLHSVDIPHSRLTSPVQETENWSQLLAGLKKRPVPALPESQKKKAAEPKNPSKTMMTEGSVLGKRVRKPCGTKEVIPLTVDTNGKPLNASKSASGKKGKENVW